MFVIKLIKNADVYAPEHRVPESINCGVTAVLVILGPDCISSNLENLLAKASSLMEKGISAYMLTVRQPFDVKIRKVAALLHHPRLRQN